MSFKQAWYIKDYVVKVELYGDLTAEEIAKSFKVSGQFLQETSAHRIHFIHDWSRIKNFPTNFSEIRQLIDTSRRDLVQKVGSIVIYGATQESLKFIGDLTFQLFQIRTHMTTDLNSALAFLCIQDPALCSVMKTQAHTDVSWYLDGHILYCYDVIKPDDMMRRNQNAYELIKAQGKPPYVHMLIDFSTTDIDEYHVSLRSLARRARHSPVFEAARDQLIQHPLFGWVVVFGIKNANLNVGGKINAMRTNYKRKDVDTLDEALTFLKQIDPNVARLLDRLPENK